MQYIYDSEPEEEESNHDDLTCNDDDDSFDLSFDLDSEGAQEKVDEFFSHSMNSSRPRGVNPEHLSKIWHISQEDTRRTINTTTQASVQTQDPTLSRNHGTNDRMLRYKRIQDISSWTHSLLLRKVDNPHEGTHAANSLSQTKDSYMSCPCEGNWKSFK